MADERSQISNVDPNEALEDATTERAQLITQLGLDARDESPLQIGISLQATP